MKIAEVNIKSDDDNSLKHLDSYPGLKNRGYFDILRGLEYERLDNDDHVYLDFTGGNLYGVTQVNRHLECLAKVFWGIRTQQIQLQ